MTGDSPAAGLELSATETERVRARARLMIEITARCGRFRGGLLQAAARLTPEEEAIVSLTWKRPTVSTSFSCGICCTAPTCWWISLTSTNGGCFPPVSHQRISSHHPEIDKKRFPDYGMRGPLVREKLHGRTVHGTRLQLEKTPATMTAGSETPSQPHRPPASLRAGLLHLPDHPQQRRPLGAIGRDGTAAHVPITPTSG